MNGTSGVYCEQKDNSCLNGGTSLINKESNIPYCQCPLNTIGERCETIQTLCTSITCSNNGVCFINASAGNNTASCRCSQGYTGEYCETLLPSCLHKPCGDKGTCIPTSDSSYYCICPDGLTGQSCNSSKLIFEYRTI